MPGTGEICQISGVYQCSIHENIIHIKKGHVFPPCQAPGPDPDHGAHWIFVKAL